MPTPESDVVTLLRSTFYYVGQASVLLPVYIGFRRWAFLSAGMRALLYCCLMWIFMMALGEFCGKVLDYNLIVWQTVDILELWFLGAIYYCTLRFRVRRYFPLIGVLYTVFALVDMFVLNDLWHGMQHKLITNNNYTVVLKHLLLFSFILLYFEQSLRHLRRLALERDPVFVASVTILVYYAASLVLTLVRSTLTDSMLYQLTIMLASFLNLLLHAGLARAFWLAGRPTPDLDTPLTPAASFMQPRRHT